MLEDIAIQYVIQTEDNLRLIGYGVAIVGAIAAGLFHKSNAELQRAPYFAYSGLLFFVVATSQIVWFGSVSAMVGGYLWVFMLVDVVVRLGVGYAIGVIAMARSRDAYGHGRMAVLAFIPLANFWLLLTPAKNDVSATRAPTIPLLTGGFGVLVGFALMFAGIATLSYVQIEMSRMATESGNDPTLQQASIDMMLRSQGLESTLRQMAAEVPSQRVDETTTLLRVESDGAVLRYIYEVSTNLEVLPISMRTGLTQSNCTNEAIRPLILAGATLEHVYLRLDGSEIGTLTVTKEICRL